MIRKYTWMLLLPVLFSAASFKLFPSVKTVLVSKLAPADKIVFVENDWNAAVKKASAQKKWIFVDCYATWCGPCKMLKIRTFTNKKVADFFNKNFINVSIDMEAGQGPMLAQQWKIQAYPTLIIFDENAKPVLGTMGFMAPDDLMRFAAEALKKK
ncbi:MAG: thioredoxin family protein [Mucilaginibacter sp.]|uniref:thioredoxin family protein n=1 Tax=Mucilaginibacter sp. TaxID=1882438 RepID=UPI0034E51749